MSLDATRATPYTTVLHQEAAYTHPNAELLKYLPPVPHTAASRSPGRNSDLAMGAAGWPTTAVDTDLPNPARVHDAPLGSHHNFRVDRAQAQDLLKAVPDVRRILFAERRFLERAVTFCLNAGVRQVLDFSSGIVSAGNAPQVAQRVAPASRVVCVDLDPVVVEQTPHILKANDRAEILQADLRRPDHILDQCRAQRLLNIDEPITVLLVCVLHLLGDQDDPCSILARLRGRLAAGSHVVISHLSADSRQADMATVRQRLQGAGRPVTMRSRTEVRRLCSTATNLSTRGDLGATVATPPR